MDLGTLDTFGCFWILLDTLHTFGYLGYFRRLPGTISMDLDTLDTCGYFGGFRRLPGAITWIWILLDTCGYFWILLDGLDTFVGSQVPLRGFGDFWILWILL